MSLNASDEHTRDSYRKQARAARQAMSGAERGRAELAVVDHLERVPEYRSATRIAGYCAVTSELSLTSLFSAERKRERFLYLPVVGEDFPGLLFAPWKGDSGSLVPNRFGIAEPIADVRSLLAAAALDLILLPLVAFDRCGYRLGSGAGFYDRALEGRLSAPAPPLLIGIAFACQQVPPIPQSRWDVPLDIVITEREIIRFH